MNVDKFLKLGFLERTEKDEKLVEKELKEAEYDLGKARIAFQTKDYKWCIIKCYYSMFHSAKSVLFRLGFREKKHFVIVEVLEELNKDGKLEIRFVNDFRAGMSSREDADYHYTHSEDTAIDSLNTAKEFIERMCLLLKIL